MIGLILALGSNVGDCENNLKQAIKLLSKYFKVIDYSSLYLSKAVDYLEQDDFFNIVIECTLPKFLPAQVLGITQSIEKRMGRIKKIDKGPRIIDIDIIFYGQDFLQEKNLVIPHQKINERNFVLFPLRELKSYNKLNEVFKLNPNIPLNGIKIIKTPEEFLC